jgi:dihydrolipoamide dehydrogenase
LWINLPADWDKFLNKGKINFIQGRASFINSSKLKIEKDDGEAIEHTFEKAIIATGSVIATIPSINIQSKRLLNSTSALDLPEIPKSLLVVGGGYIGLELGSVYQALGTKVSVVEMLPGLLPGADRDLVNFLVRKIKDTYEGCNDKQQSIGHERSQEWNKC